MTHKGPANPEKSFGISVGIVLLLIAGFLVWRERLATAQIVGGIGAVLLVLGLVQPRLLKWPSAVWWRFALILGYVNARIILTVIFTIVFSPLGLLWRIIGTVSRPLSQVRSLHADVLRLPMAKSRVLSEFFQFLKQEKKYWLMPIVIVFILFGLLIVFSQSSAVAPFIYTLF